MGGHGDDQERLDRLTLFEKTDAGGFVDFIIVELLHLAGGDPFAIVADAFGDASRLCGRAGLDDGFVIDKGIVALADNKSGHGKLHRESTGRDGRSG